MASISIFAVVEVELEESTEDSCCLICSSGLSKVSSTFTKQQSILSKHLEIILLLKNVFELPSKQLTQFLRKCPSVENWIRICEKCEQLVNQFKSLHEQMINLKMKIIGTLKASLTDSDNDTDVVIGEINDKQNAEEAILNIADECRRFVKKHEYGPVKTPTSSPNYHHDPQKEVKQEINEDTDDNDDDNYSPLSPRDLEIKPEDSNCDLEDHLASASNRNSSSSPTRKSTRIKTSVATTAAVSASKLPYPKCDQIFPTKTSLNVHLSTSHKYSPDIANRTCTICDTLFFDTPTLRRHLVNIHGFIRKPKINYGTQTKCAECSKNLRTPYHLYRHAEQVHKNNIAHLCDLCGKRLSSKPVLDNHRKYCGTNILEDGTLKKRTKCPVEGCTSYYLRDDLLQKHVKEHRMPPSWKCSKCLQNFHSKKLLLRHEKAEHGIGKFICEHCGKIFHLGVLLRCHQKSSLKCKLIYQTKVEATVKCEECGRLCASQAIFRRHVKVVHEKKFDWKCEECGVGYVDRNWLVFHLKKKHDLGEYKWKCGVEGCGKGFAFKNYLDSHVKGHEGGKGVKCGECGKGFDNEQRLKGHQRKVHGERVVCGSCGKGFKSQVYLNFHLRHSHKDGVKF